MKKISRVQRFLRFGQNRFETRGKMEFNKIKISFFNQRQFHENKVEKAESSSRLKSDNPRGFDIMVFITVNSNCNEQFVFLRRSRLTCSQYSTDVIEIWMTNRSKHLFSKMSFLNSFRRYFVQ